MRDSLLPEGGHPKALTVYPKQRPGCLTVGASAGAVNPKTHRKWVWAFIDTIANLVNAVVNLTYNVRMVWSVIVIVRRRTVPIAAK